MAGDSNTDPLAVVDSNAGTARVRRPFLRKLLATMGPGLMVCFADTDGSCLLTAGDSGSKWDYKLLLLQGILVPILYFAQELAVRLALHKRKGLCELLRHEVGPRLAWAVAVPLLLDAFLALISEIDVVGQTMNVCWGIPVGITNTVFTLLLLALALTGSYNIAEKVGLAMGVLQVFFFGTMFMSKPDLAKMWNDLWVFPLDQPSYVKLVTANIGAVIMPWMLSYQQSALCKKELEGDDDAETTSEKEKMLIERIDTGVGSFLTQGVMAAMLITVAASPQFSGEDINGVEQLLAIFTDVMGGELQAKLLLSFAIVGACTVAAIVVSLCGAWALEEAQGHGRIQSVGFSGGVLNGIAQNLKARSSFYVAYVSCCIVAWLVTVFAKETTNSLTGVWTQFVNGLLMPPVIFTLWYLSAYKLDEEHRLSPFLKWSLFVIFGVCSAFCLASIPLAVADATGSSTMD